MRDKSKKVIDAIKEYQEPGSVGDFDENNFEQNGCGVEWSRHVSGTMGSGIGRFFLGMPKAFSRLGVIPQENFQIHIFPTLESMRGIWEYDKFNIPCWKYLNPKGHTFVRGLMPRINNPFIHIILEDCMDKIDCVEITEKDQEEMD